MPVVEKPSKIAAARTMPTTMPISDDAIRIPSGRARPQLLASNSDRDPGRIGSAGSCPTVTAPHEPYLGSAHRRPRRRRRDHGDAARAAGRAGGELLRGWRPRRRRLRGDLDRVCDPPRLRRLSRVRELRHVPQRRRDRGAGRRAAIPDGPAPSGRVPGAALGGARLLRAQRRVHRVAGDAERQGQQPDQPLERDHVPHVARHRAAGRRRSRPHTPSGSTSSPTGRSPARTARTAPRA